MVTPRVFRCETSGVCPGRLHRAGTFPRNPFMRAYDNFARCQPRFERGWGSGQGGGHPIAKLRPLPPWEAKQKLLDSRTRPVRFLYRELLPWPCDRTVHRRDDTEGLRLNVERKQHPISVRDTDAALAKIITACSRPCRRSGKAGARGRAYSDLRRWACARSPSGWSYYSAQASGG